MPSQMGPIEWLQDVSPAGWIASRLHPSMQDVGSVIPDGFEAYGRLFHPVDGGGRRKRWSDVARRNQRIVHPEMQFHWISRPLGQRPPEGYHPGDGPSWGSLFVTERRVLVEFLARCTTAPESCFFCVWEGTGPLNQGVDAEWHTPGLLSPLTYVCAVVGRTGSCLPVHRWSCRIAVTSCT
ncbi:MAG: hypothetical protein ACRD2W_16930 [Acidimicrobiales bacterium]